MSAPGRHDLDLIEAFVTEELAVRLESYCARDTAGRPDRDTCDAEHLPFLVEAEVALKAVKRLRSIDSTPLFAIGLERLRQIAAENFTAERDDAYTQGQLAKAAAAYAWEASGHDGSFRLWPFEWSMRWFKSQTPRRDLIKAGALIVAEIERLDRAASKGEA